MQKHKATLDRRSFLGGSAVLSASLLHGGLERPLEAQQPATAERNAWTWGPFGPSNSLGKYIAISYPTSSNKEELQLDATYNFWLPDGIQKVRGIIVHQHGASIPAAQAGATAVYDLHWQAFAKKWDCVLLGPSYKVLNDAIDLTPGGAELWFDPRHGSEKTFLRALQDAASQSGHPEIAEVPWALWGHSGGGIWSNVMSMLHPDRVAAVFLRSGTAGMFSVKPEFPEPQIPEAVYAIPTMTNAGVEEQKNIPWTGSIATFQDYRSHGAPIGFAPDPRTGHFTGDSRYFAIPFLDACLEMRLPDKGAANQKLKPVDHSDAWLAKFMDDTALPASSFQDDERKAVWLPNAKVAHIWMEYVRQGTVASSEIPPTPFNVRVTQKANGNEITWDAEAGLESGIGGFVVTRNGRGIARLPERPPDRVFGRPLFQGLSFHDTPEAPYPRMAYLDTTAPVGRKNSYSVIALSSAGVGSHSAEPAVAG